MPKYDVKCKKCEWEGEIEHSIVEDHPPCKRRYHYHVMRNYEDGEYQCGGRKLCDGELVTQFKQAPAIRFIGEGWESNDRNIKDQQQYSAGRMKERKQNLKDGGGISDMDGHKD